MNGLVRAVFVLVALTACTAEVPRNQDEASVGVLRVQAADDSAEMTVECPNWYQAPAGTVWHSRFHCDQCDDVYQATYLSGGSEITVWKRAGMTCECIDENGRILDTPECGPTE